MTSFPVEIEPSPRPRLAAGVLLLHLTAAAFPWLTRCPPWLAAALSVLAIAALAATLARVPGPHCRLVRLSFRDDAWWVRLAGESHDTVARIGAGTRVYAGLIALDLRVEDRRLGWLLPRATLGQTDFRRLKARLRMT